MKKPVTLFLSSLFAFSAVMAQDADLVEENKFVSKRGVNIFPEAGEFALGFNAIPVLRYFGNAMNGSNNPTAPNWVQDQSNTLVGKYMVDENTAYRGRIQAGLVRTTTTDALVTKDEPVSTGAEFVEDKWSVGSTNVVLGAGIEKRRGKGRVKGVYGAELWFNYASTTSTAEYGNALTATSPTRTIANDLTTGDLGIANVNALNTTGNGYVTSHNGGTTLGVAAYGFVGVEYFFAPKISLGTEFGYNVLGFSRDGDGERTVEYYDAAAGAVKSEQQDVKINSTTLQFLNPNNVSAAVNLLFYF